MMKTNTEKNTMNLATTVQFRKAVAATALILGIPLARQSVPRNQVDYEFVTWTNYSNRTRRTVGYPFEDGVDGKNRLDLVAMIEKVLNVQGVTAKTRISKLGYLRGSCMAVPEFDCDFDRY